MKKASNFVASHSPSPPKTPDQPGQTCANPKKQRKNTYIGKLKSDQGFKTVLRGIRKAIKKAFDVTDLGTGKHHWKEAKWMEKGREFLEQYLKLKKVSNYEVAAINLLLYHSFGPSKKKPVDKTSIIYNLLKEDGMDLFKCIFDNNSKELVTKFFSHFFVRRLWPTVLEYLTWDVVFGRKMPNQEIQMTYRDITRQITQEFKFEMPEWWTTLYPPTAEKLTKK